MPDPVEQQSPSRKLSGIQELALPMTEAELDRLKSNTAAAVEAVDKLEKAIGTIESIPFSPNNDNSKTLEKLREKLRIVKSIITSNAQEAAVLQPNNPEKEKDKSSSGQKQDPIANILKKQALLHSLIKKKIGLGKLIAINKDGKAVPFDPEAENEEDESVGFIGEDAPEVAEKVEDVYDEFRKLGFAIAKKDIRDSHGITKAAYGIASPEGYDRPINPLTIKRGELERAKEYLVRSQTRRQPQSSIPQIPTVHFHVFSREYDPIQIIDFRKEAEEEFTAQLLGIRVDRLRSLLKSNNMDSQESEQDAVSEGKTLAQSLSISKAPTNPLVKIINDKQLNKDSNFVNRALNNTKNNKGRE